MKIAIKGHSTRGKEVIQILESLGGINSACLHGDGTLNYYYICNDNRIRCGVLKGYKIYTLEKFEKEFPFKVGDKVQTTPSGEPAEIIEIHLNPACEIAYKVRYKSGVELQHCPENLKFYKEMKEGRNITLTLDKAKEWYKKGGELKEIALQAYSEEELAKVELPKSFKEFCKNYPVQKGEAWLGIQDGIYVCSDGSQPRYYKNWMPSKKSAEAHLAMMQLEQLRDCWRQGWKPGKHESVYTIKFSVNGLAVYQYSSREFLSFPTREMAEEFLECFRDLIEKAGDLI